MPGSRGRDFVVLGGAGISLGFIIGCFVSTFLGFLTSSSFTFCGCFGYSSDLTSGCLLVAVDGFFEIEESYETI